MGLLNWFSPRKGADPPPASPSPSQTPPASGAATAPPGPQGETAQTPSDRSPTPHRVLLLHGYSSNGKEFKAWKDKLAANFQNAGTDTQIAGIEIGNYVTLNNEVTLKDLGEAFDRALRFTPWSGGSKDDSWTFDAIVHSTGMLVLRQWLVCDPYPVTDSSGKPVNDPRSRRKRLKHIVGLAPATFGSPQAKKGRSWLGALVKGNRILGPDFMNAGDQVLDGLELGSRYTWDLAHKDMLAAPPLYDQGPDTPYVAVFIGNKAYTGIAELANSPGTDGTVRWAGCALNTRLVELDFRREGGWKDEAGRIVRAKISRWLDGRLECPMIAIDGQNHSSILSDPDDDTVLRVGDFLRTVKNDESYTEWLDSAKAGRAAARNGMDTESVDPQTRIGGRGWQQFVLHVKDDHGEPVKDYNVRLFIGDSLDQSNNPDFPGVPLIADTYSSDASFRCFYVRLTDEMLAAGTPDSPKKVWMELIASSGTAFLEYEAYVNVEDQQPDSAVKTLSPRRPEAGTIQPTQMVKLELSNLGPEAKLFYEYTTTLVEITLEREPTPLQQVSGLFGFLGYPTPTQS